MRTAVYIAPEFIFVTLRSKDSKILSGNLKLSQHCSHLLKFSSYLAIKNTFCEIYKDLFILKPYTQFYKVNDVVVLYNSLMHQFSYVYSLTAYRSYHGASWGLQSKKLKYGNLLQRKIDNTRSLLKRHMRFVSPVYVRLLFFILSSIKIS